MKKIQTDSFTIAHYILLFLVIVVVVWLVLWGIRSTRGGAVADSAKPVSMTEPCAQQTINRVADMWLNSPGAIPQKYLDMMEQHANRIVNVKTRGNCNGTAFVCEMGAIRSSCDPCAAVVARQMAIDQHTSDMIRENCNILVVQ